MAKKVEIIRELEADISKELMELELKDIFGTTNGYSLNENSDIIGLNLCRCGISNIMTLEKFTQLKYLDLRSNNLSDLSPLKNLKYLNELNLWNNKAADLSPLKNLKELRKLYLENNQITELSPLKDLKYLKCLYLYENNVADISSLQYLKNLNELNLWNNHVSDLSPLKELKNLTHLWLNNNNVSELSPLKELKNLVMLDLSDNSASDIPHLNELKKLTKLDLKNNQISDLSPLQGLKKLKELYLEGNHIPNLSPLLELKDLKRLNITNNQIAKLPFQILQLGLEIKWKYDKSSGIFLKDNPLEEPPIEIVKQGTEAVRNYFKEIKPVPVSGHKFESQIAKKDEARETTLLRNSKNNKPKKIVKPVEPKLPTVDRGEVQKRTFMKKVKDNNIPRTVCLLESKLLIVGNGEVGKTTLMKKLKDESFKCILGQELPTHGINIEPWELCCTFADGKKAEDVKIHLWDFGGQEIYHATHQFFLTKRSLYLFVWEPRKEEETISFDYWLNIIKLLSDKSPVIVVMNKSDIRIKHIDEASYKNKFPNIINFHQISCLKEEGILELIENIRTQLGRMAHLKDKLPIAWMQIRDHLVKENRDYISLDNYIDICQKYGLNEKRAEFVSAYLHDLGVILHFRHDKLLENTVILNPEWATSAVYALVDTREIQENKGRFHLKDLKKYWDLYKFPLEKHPQLIRLMEKFELCFQITDTDTYIVPELLPANRPLLELKKYKNKENLHFEYYYDFMPKGIITRFISRKYYLIKNENFWKNGVELRFEDSTALVISDSLNRKLKISTTGSYKSELLAIIRSDLDHIHQTLNMERNTHYNEMIPCGCSECRESESPLLYKYENLKKHIDKGVYLIRCGESIKEVSIETMLKGFEHPIREKDLLKTLITTLHQLQGISKTIKSDEDSRNSFISLILSIYGFNVKDQTRWGSSASGKSMGYLDIKIENLENEAESVAEAFILKKFDRSYIDSHLRKLFGYDPSGLLNNFIIVYSEDDDFLGLWEKYITHLPEIDFKYKITKGPEEEESPFAEIKLARTYHMRKGKNTIVHHLFVNMKL